MKRGMTLNIDDRTLRAALDHARMKGIDLSVLVEKFLLKFISGKEDGIQDIQISDKVKALVGILATEESEEEKGWRDRKSEYLNSKH